MNRLQTTGLGGLAGVASVALGWWAAGMFTAPAGMTGRPTSAGPVKPARPGAGTSGGLDASFAAVWAAGDASAQMAAAVAMAESVAPGDFARFLEMLDRMPAHAAQGLATRTLLRRWTALDPQAALQWCLDHNGDFAAGVAGEWARLDPGKVDDILAMVSNSPVENTRSGSSGASRAAAEIFKVLASRDREAAMELLRHPKLRGGSAVGWIDHSLRLLARQDPAWMLARAESLSDSIRPAVRKAVAHAMAETSMPDAFAWAREQPDRTALVSAMMQPLKNLPDLLAELASWSPEEQIGVRVRPPNVWVDGDQALLVEAIESHAALLSDQVVKDLLRSAPGNLHLASDPGALANRLLALPAAAEHFRAIDVASNWAEQSPEAALAWASSLADASQRQEAVAAVNIVATATPSVPVRSLAEELVHQAGQGNISEDQQWLALSASERRQVLDAGLTSLAKIQKGDPDPFSSSLDAVGARYPAEVAEWMTHTLTAENTPRLMPALTTAASAWAGENPAAAAAWAAGLPPGEARAWAAANVIGQWRLFDEPAARAWIKTLPPDERAIALKAVPELLTSP